jgi:IS4 transposase
MVKVKISDKTDEVLLTNLLKEEFDTKDITNLYGRRCGIELSYNTLKNKIKIESFTGFLPSFVYQDFFAQMLIYNILQDALHLANSKLNVILYKRQIMYNKNYKKHK